MSLFTDASLVYVPSGVKDAKTYSIKPTDGSGDLTFSRGSDIEATRVNANGYIEKAQVNLLLQSNTFNTTWATTSATLTSGQAGYDGTNDAWLLEAFSSGTYRRISQNTNVNAVMTNSIYAKAGTVDFIGVSDTNGSTSNVVFFDLANGVIHSITNAGQIIDAQIESVGGGWYRCSAALTGNTSGTALWFVSATGGSSSNAGDNVYIQDAAQCYGLVAQTYQETTTAAVVSGITDNMPRLNYDPANPTCPSLLLEKSSTNVITSSEHLGSLSVSNVSVSYNNATSPEGVQNATLVTGDAGSGVKVVNFNSAANGSYTISVFAKYNTHQWIQLGQGGVATYANFDIQNGVTGGTNGTSSIEDYGGGWYRCSVVTTTGTPVSHYIGMVDSGTAVRLASSSSTNSYWAYGMQSELGSYPTSYIPTYGSSATRTADFSEVTFADNTIAPTANTTLFFEVQLTGLLDESPNTGGFNFKNQAGTNNRLNFNYGYGRIYSNYVSGGTSAFYDSNAGDTIKVAFQLTNGGKSFVNGVHTSTTIRDWSSDTFGNPEFSFGHLVKQYIIFDSVLSDAECITLTTL